jgi:transcriptional regulator with XRE-family HTH domain
MHNKNMKTTVTYISEKTGLSKAYVSELLSGKKNNPTYNTLVKICKVLKTQPDLQKIRAKFSKLRDAV